MLDIMTGMMVVLIVFDVSSILFSVYVDEMGVKRIVNDTIIFFNYMIVSIICFYSYYNTSFHFMYWNRYISHYDGCFYNGILDRLLINASKQEIAGARYMNIVRIILTVVYIVLSIVYIYRYTYNNKSIRISYRYTSR